MRRPKSQFSEEQYYTGSPAADAAPGATVATTPYGTNDTGGATTTYPDQYAAYNPNYGGAKTSSSHV